MLHKLKIIVSGLTILRTQYKAKIARPISIPILNQESNLPPKIKATRPLIIPETRAKATIPINSGINPISYKIASSIIPPMMYKTHIILIFFQ